MKFYMKERNYDWLIVKIIIALLISALGVFVSQNSILRDKNAKLQAENEEYKANIEVWTNDKGDYLTKCYSRKK